MRLHLHAAVEDEAVLQRQQSHQQLPGTEILGGGLRNTRTSGPTGHLEDSDILVGVRMYRHLSKQHFEHVQHIVQNFTSLKL